MKVKELIEYLKNIDENTEVVTRVNGSDFRSLETSELNLIKGSPVISINDTTLYDCTPISLTADKESVSLLSISNIKGWMRW